jgi:predicted transcriptional regulator
MAEMLIQGSSMGMIDNTKTLNTHKNLSPQVAKLTQRLNQIEENNVQAMKRYLS